MKKGGLIDVSEFMGKWITVRMAARLLKVSKQRVNELCKNGQLGWCKTDGTVWVRRSSVEERLADREVSRAR
jgi:excisionase family DNA binding protein